MTTELVRLLAVVSGVVIVIAGIAWWWISRPARVTQHTSDEVLPLFSGSTPLPGQPAAPAADAWSAGSTVAPERIASPPRPVELSPPPVTRPRPAPPVGPPVEPSAAPPAETTRPARMIREFTTGIAPVPPAPPAAPTVAVPNDRSGEVPVVDDAGVPGTMVEGHLLRFGIPADGTLQFLPGRLEIRSGLDTGREIRFVQTGVAGGPEVTFGRLEGDPYRHVQLRDRTVSRQHATLRWRNGQWFLENLSTTNPVVHNGRELSAGETVPLVDGDRLEMGEVQFTYRFPPAQP